MSKGNEKHLLDPRGKIKKNWVCSLMTKTGNIYDMKSIKSIIKYIQNNDSVKNSEKWLK